MRFMPTITRTQQVSPDSAAQTVTLGRGMDYTAYRLSFREWIASALMAGAALFVLGYIFYQHVLPAFLLFVCGAYYPRIRQKEKKRRLQEELKLQFQQALYMLSSSLSAGRSLEGSIPEVIKDLKLLYPDDHAPIVREFSEIKFKLDNGIRVEAALHDLSRRAGVDEITQFADVFSICKRTGGNLVEVIRMTSRTIGDKIRIQQEMMVMVSQKRFEARALSVLPIGIIALLIFTSPDYMYPLFKGAGRLLMTVALVLLVLSQLWCKHIMEIEV